MRQLLISGLLLGVVSPFLVAQSSPISQQEFPYQFETGPLVNHSRARSVILEDVVHVPNVAWLRLDFDRITLGKAPRGGIPTILRITSLADGAVQTLNTRDLLRWRHTSAYFNGDAVLVEILADSGSEASSLSFSKIITGPFITSAPKRRSICGDVDDRTLSNDDRHARIVPVGCSGWLIDDNNHCFLTAGHCVGGSFDIVEFNVPISNEDGSLNHPGPEDQYPIDQDSIQFTNGGTGNDWAYFGAFPNTQTGLTPFEAQGVFYTLADPPDPSGQNIRITGYGTTSAPVSNTFNQAQKTHLGPFVSVSGTLLRYATDTTGGNSGSPIEHEESGTAIGIHTHAGCDVSGGSNQGTNITHPDLQNALANPLGVCGPPPPLAFDLPEATPELLPDTGASIRVEITAEQGFALDPATAMLHYDNGAGISSVAMNEVSPGVYDAVFPDLTCETSVSYNFSASTMTGDTVFHPAEETQFTSFVASAVTHDWIDDFETDTGWRVEDDANLTDGTWERAVPSGGGLRGDPPSDADGSGFCYVTSDGEGNTDVDAGHSLLTSPVLDATVFEEPYLVYYRWFANDGNDVIDDVLVIDISTDDGVNWTNLETVGPSGDGTHGGWIPVRLRLTDFVTPSNTIRVRFDVSDVGGGSVVEAGIDAVSITDYSCMVDIACPGDLNDDGQITQTDLDMAYAAWGNEGVDMDDDELANIIDLLILSRSFGACP